MDLGVFGAFTLVLGAVIYSAYRKLQMQKELLLTSIRAFVQLMLMAFVLGFVLELESLLFMGAALLLMALYAARVANSRVEIDGGYLIYLFAIGFSSFLVLGLLVWLGAINTRANEIIPIGGMIIGNSLNIVTLLNDRLKSDIENTRGVIEAKIALGLNIKDALHENMNASIKMALTPILNNLKTIGLVFIPGAMTGMIIAGADPLSAASYQLTIMYMITAVALLSGVLTALLSYRKLVMH